MRFELIISSVLALVTVFISVKINSSSLNIEAETYKKTYTYVEQMPQIIGGVAEFYNEISAINPVGGQVVNCKVFLQFVVKTDGEAINPESLSTNIIGCDKLAIEGLKKVSFKPGYHNGEEVPVITTMPVNFRMKI